MTIRVIKNQNNMLKITAVVFFVITVICNALANLLPINNITSGEVSDSYPNLFAPIGFTFSIWSLIYLLLAGFCIYQFTYIRNGRSKLKEDMLNKILPYFIGTSILNSLWIFSWHYKKITLSLVLIVLLLFCLARISNILSNSDFRKLDQLFIKTPFSIYCGWVTVAVIANVTTWLVSIGWDALNFSEVFWVSLVLTVGALIALINTDKDQDPVYLAVFLWAYFGILAKHISSSGFNEQYPEVVTVLIIILGLFSYRMFTLRNIISSYFKQY